MSSFDFAVTVAIGSTVAGTVMSKTPSLAEGVVALVALIGSQRIVAELRARAGASSLVDNQPVLLMSGDWFHHDAMKAARVTPGDITGNVWRHTGQGSAL